MGRAGHPLTSHLGPHSDGIILLKLTFHCCVSLSSSEPVLLYFRHCHCAISPVPFLVNDESVKTRKFSVIFSRGGFHMFLGQEGGFRKEVRLGRAHCLWFS